MQLLTASAPRSRTHSRPTCCRTPSSALPSSRANGLDSGGGARAGGRSEARGRGGGGQRGLGCSCWGGGGLAERPRVVGGWGLRTPALGGAGRGRECRAGVRVPDAGWSAEVSVGRRHSLRPRRLRFEAAVTRGGRLRIAVQGPVGPRGGPEGRRCGCGQHRGPGRGPRAPGPSDGEGSPARAMGAPSAAGEEKSGGRERSLGGHTDPHGPFELSDVAPAAGERLVGWTFIPFQFPRASCSPGRFPGHTPSSACFRNAGAPFPFPCCIPSLGLHFRLPHSGSFWKFGGIF